LQREGRVSYSALQYEFGFDQAFLNVLKRDLIFKRLASDEDGEGLCGQAPEATRDTTQRLLFQNLNRGLLKLNGAS
jgi:hypothetical protein